MLGGGRNVSPPLFEMLESFVIIMRGSYWESVTVKTCMVALSSGAPSALVKGALERMIRSCDHEEIPSSASPPPPPFISQQHLA